MNQEEKMQYVDDDEIDLFDLLKTLWRWKWFVIGITAGAFVAAFLFLTLQPEKPDTYTARADVQVGKIANVNIESVGDLAAYLQSDEFAGGTEALQDLQYEFNKFEDMQFPDSKNTNFIVSGEEGFRYTLMLTISFSSQDAERAESVVQTASQRLIARHAGLYRSAKERYEGFRLDPKEYLEDSPKYLPLLWLDSYTYPTRINRAVTVERDVPEDKTAVTLAVAALAGLILSIMLAFMIEAIRNRIKAERDAAQ